MVQYAATSLPGVTPKEKDSGHSDIEWLIDVFTEADRRGDAVAFADVYETSSLKNCLLYTSPSPRDLSTSRMPSSA